MTEKKLLPDLQARMGAYHGSNMQLYTSALVGLFEKAAERFRTKADAGCVRDRLSLTWVMGQAPQVPFGGLVAVLSMLDEELKAQGLSTEVGGPPGDEYLDVTWV